jgi:hypothetical protein
MKLKTALADTEDALREYAEIEGKTEEEIDKHDKIMEEMISHGKHKNLSFFAFTATPKDKFGTEYKDGSFHPFHIYSMRQAIEENFILDVLQNYMTYDTCYKIANNTTENPDNESIILIVKGQYIGTGFDEPRLETLFLAMPVSWKGVLSKYAENLNPDYNVTIFDYVDINVTMFEKKYKDRLSGYKRLGYKIAEKTAEDSKSI